MIVIIFGSTPLFCRKTSFRPDSVNAQNTGIFADIACLAEAGIHVFCPENTTEAIFLLHCLDKYVILCAERWSLFVLLIRDCWFRFTELFLDAYLRIERFSMRCSFSCWFHRTLGSSFCDYSYKAYYRYLTVCFSGSPSFNMGYELTWDNQHKL